MAGFSKRFKIRKIKGGTGWEVVFPSGRVEQAGRNRKDAENYIRATRSIHRTSFGTKKSRMDWI